MSEAAYTGVGTAQLSSELDGDGPYKFNGVALGADDITVGNSGIKKKWPGEELRKAASSLEGKPLVEDHQNNTDGRVGTVTKAWYDEGVGVRYEAELAPHYEQLAKDIKAGIQEVSARAYHDPVEELDQEDETGAMVVENVVFDNLSVVSQGASPSNTANFGSVDTSGAVAMAQGPAGGAVATLESGVPRNTAELAEFGEGDWVKGDSSGGTWHGKVRGMKSDGCYSDKIDGDQEICADDDSPVYLIENYDPEDGEFTDTMVAHKESGVKSWDHDENAQKAEIDMIATELESDEDELDEVYSDWDDAVNMTASQLDEWADHPCADQASVDPEAVRDRNMHLLETDKSDWGSDEMEDAKRTISFVSRMSDEENKPDAPKDGANGCPSDWAVSLLNWAHNPFDSMPDKPDNSEEENGMYMKDNDADMSDMPKANVGDTPEWEEGDMVRWQVEPDLFGKIVHVDEEKHVAMVEIMGMEDGSMTSTGFTITAGFSDIKPMQSPQSMADADADMSGHKDDEAGMSKHGDAMMARYADNDDLYAAESEAQERADEIGCEGTHSMEIEGEEMHMPCGTHQDYEESMKSMMSAYEVDSVEELAEINDLSINGTVMWDDKMGVISDFMTEDGTLMVEIDIVEKDDGKYKKTGDTETAPLHEMESMSAQITDKEAEQLESAWHTPDWSGTDSEREWSKPAMEDFDTDDMSEIDDHFLVSDTGEWPPENYSDLSLPVVFPDGDLSLDGLDSAHQMAGQVDGVSEDMADKLQSEINSIAEDKFGEPVEDEEMNSGSPNIAVASLVDDDTDTNHRSSTMDIAALQIDNTNTIMTDIDYQNATEADIEDLSEPVVMEEEELEELRSKAAEADELSEQLDTVNSSIEELAENQEALEGVDEDRLEELQEYDDAVVLTDEEHEELTGLVDEIGQVFADELADYSPFDADELQDRFTPLELRDKVEDHEDASVTDELGASEEDPEPEGGSADPEELEQTDAEVREELTEEEIREVVAEDLEDGKMYRQAEKVRDGDIELEELGIDPSELAN